MSPAAPVLKVEQLGVVFPDGNGGLRALERVSFEVCPREFVCVLGASGSGKTTLLRALAGLLPPTQGSVHFARGAHAAHRNGLSAIQPDALAHAPWPISRCRLSWPDPAADEARRRAQEMIQLVGLRGFEASLPRELSGGMAQRVAIARALVHDPDLLLLDEPFGSLDALTRERMGVELSRIWQKRRKTVVMVTHSITESLFLADRVLVLSRRPGTVRLDLKVDLPRPRTEEVRFTAHFGRLAKKLRAALE